MNSGSGQCKPYHFLKECKGWYKYDIYFEEGGGVKQKWDIIGDWKYSGIPISII